MMSRNLRFARLKRNPPAVPGRGFTLVELLVVMIILGILASMVSFAMFRSQQSARQAKTQALIAKLHTVIARQWDTYATRRVEGTTLEKLEKLRQLMRCELPNRWEDIDDTDLPTPKPVLTTAYQNYNPSFASADPNQQNAECLYMIVSMLADDDLDRINLFSEDEVGDFDNDGFNEFHDAWGNPILFLRWPVGFVDQPYNFSSTEPIGHLSDLQQNDPTGSPDPFDPLEADPRADSNTKPYAIFPLIYSAGPDKIYDIFAGVPTSDGGGTSDDPYAGIDQGHDAFGTGSQIGAPRDQGTAGGASSNNQLDHHDNIHNHRLNARLR